MHLRQCKAIIFAAILLTSSEAIAIQTHTKLWTAGIIEGGISDDKKTRLFIEQDIRFVDDKYKFQQALLWLGLGYRPLPNLTLYAGDTPDVYRNLQGEYIHQQIVWQQVSWIPIDNPSYRLTSMTRPEEVKRLHESQWALILRQTLQLSLPFEHWRNHALILSETVFFNLNHPSWLSTSTLISQNRALIGIETTVTKHYSYTIGYMNQYIFSSPNQLSNVIVLNFNIKLDS